MRISISLLLLCLLSLYPHDTNAKEYSLTLRPVDRATVRVVSVGGAYSTVLESEHTKSTRVVAVPRAGHGTGTVIRKDGLILTARHVVEDSDAIAVMLPGGDKAVAAKIIYVDPDRDLAILKANAEFADVLSVGDDKLKISLGDHVSTSGYPLDVRQHYPAATSGEISRLTNSGYLQLSMSVNPGNSGGPVVSENGTLLGVLIQRGNTKAGVAGIAIVEPMNHVLKAVGRGIRRERLLPTLFGPSDSDLAHIVTRFIRAVADGKPIYSGTPIDLLNTTAKAELTPEERLIVAAQAWNMHVALLEKHKVSAVAELSGAAKTEVLALRKLARFCAKQAMASAPYAVGMYTIGRSILNSTENRQAR